MGNNQNKSLMDREDFISMILGLAIVGVVILVMVNYFKSKSGRIDLDGVTDTTVTQEEGGEEGTVSDSQQTSLAGVTDYSVVAGDSLWKIAVKKYGNGYKWTEIAKANNIDQKNYGNLEVGQKLKLPESAQAGLPTEHVVANGESLSKLALKYYGDMYAWEKIYNTNVSVVGTNPNLIMVGTKLVIPE